MGSYSPGIQTKENIVNSAIKLFYEKGSKNVTIKDICEQAGVVRPLYFYYFENKTDLLHTVYDWLDEKIDASFKENLPSGFESFTPREKLASFVTVLAKSIRKYPKARQLFIDIFSDNPVGLMTYKSKFIIENVADDLYKGLSKAMAEYQTLSIAGTYAMIFFKSLINNPSQSDDEYASLITRIPIQFVLGDAESQKVIAKILKATKNCEVNIDKIIHSNYREDLT